MNIIILTVSLFIIMLAGLFLVDIFIPKSNILERISLGFLVGTNIFTILLFILNWKFSVSYNLNNSLIVLIGFLLLSFLANFVTRKINKTKGWGLRLSFSLKKFTRLEKTIIGFLLLLIVSVVISNFYWPVKDWDALAVYDFKAISFSTTGYMDDAIGRGYFTAYPMFGSLMHTFIYLTGVNSPMFFYSLLYISMLSVFYFLLRKVSGRSMSLVGVLVLASNPLIFNHATMAYQNLPYTIYFALGVIYFSIGLENNHRSYLLLGGLVFALSNWVRMEFFLFFYLIIALYVLRAFITKKYNKKIIIPIILSSILVYLVRYVWQGFIAEKFNTDSVNIGKSIGIYIQTMLQVPNMSHLSGFFGYILKGFSMSFSFLPIIYFLCLFYLAYRRRLLLSKRLGLLLLPLWGMVYIIVGSYIFSLSYFGWLEILESFYRLIMSFLPIYYYSIIVFMSILTTALKTK